MRVPQHITLAKGSGAYHAECIRMHSVMLQIQSTTTTQPNTGLIAWVRHIYSSQLAVVLGTKPTLTKALQVVDLLLVVHTDFHIST